MKNKKVVVGYKFILLLFCVIVQFKYSYLFNTIFSLIMTSSVEYKKQSYLSFRLAPLPID